MGLGVEAEGKRVFEGEMDGCWVSEGMVKSELLTGLRMFFPQGCIKER